MRWVDCVGFYTAEPRLAFYFADNLVSVDFFLLGEVTIYTVYTYNTEMMLVTNGMCRPSTRSPTDKFKPPSSYHRRRACTGGMRGTRFLGGN